MKMYGSIKKVEKLDWQIIATIELREHDTMRLASEDYKMTCPIDLKEFNVGDEVMVTITKGSEAE